MGRVMIAVSVYALGICCLFCSYSPPATAADVTSSSKPLPESSSLAKETKSNEVADRGEADSPDSNPAAASQSKNEERKRYRNVNSYAAAGSLSLLLILLALLFLVIYRRERVHTRALSYVKSLENMDSASQPHVAISLEQSNQAYCDAVTLPAPCVTRCTVPCADIAGSAVRVAEGALEVEEVAADGGRVSGESDAAVGETEEAVVAETEAAGAPSTSPRVLVHIDDVLLREVPDSGLAVVGSVDPDVIEV